MLYCRCALECYVFGGIVLANVKWNYYLYAFFLKKRRGCCDRLRQSVRLSVMLFPNSLDEIQPNLVCELLSSGHCSHEMGLQQHIFFLRPIRPLGGVKRSNISKFQLQCQFQRFLFIPNVCVCVRACVCVLTNIRYKTFILSPRPKSTSSEI